MTEVIEHACKQSGGARAFGQKLCGAFYRLLPFTFHINPAQFSSVQFRLSVMSDSLRPHESQHSRPPCPSPTPGVYPNPCPLSR